MLVLMTLFKSCPRIRTKTQLTQSPKLFMTFFMHLLLTIIVNTLIPSQTKKSKRRSMPTFPAVKRKLVLQFNP